MIGIGRDPEGAGRRRHDLIIVGGGIYGAMLAFEATLRGLDPLLVEKDDFGGATSGNSLRIIHGGLRYLQRLNLARFHVSVRERQWLIETFPDHTHPLPFLMPLYGEGLKKPTLLGMALAVNQLLQQGCNRGMGADRIFPRGHVVKRSRAQEIFPMVRMRNLKGGAIWFDAFMPEPRRILMEILARACGKGAVALKYMRADELLVSSKRVSGIACRDMKTEKYHVFRSRVVINAAGPWCRNLAETFCKRDFPELFTPSLAWNLLLDRTPLSHHGLAVSSGKPGAQTLFLIPRKGSLLAGTGHAPWTGGPEKPTPNPQQLLGFLHELNMAVPGLKLVPADIRMVFPGLLPVRHAGGCVLKESPVIMDHGKSGGPEGFFSISGVKFTTARHVAQQTLRRIAHYGPYKVKKTVKI